jgi:hypothetical protein
MEFDEIISFAKANAPAIAFVTGAVIVLVAWARAVLVRGISYSSVSEDERRFRNVFGLMTNERREALIAYHMQKHKCGRREAMRIAVDARASDETRW